MRHRWASYIKKLLANTFGHCLVCLQWRLCHRDYPEGMSFSIRGHGLISDQTNQLSSSSGKNLQKDYGSMDMRKQIYEKCHQNLFDCLSKQTIKLVSCRIQRRSGKVQEIFKKVEKGSSVKVCNLIQHTGFKCLSWCGNRWGLISV